MTRARRSRLSSCQRAAGLAAWVALVLCAGLGARAAEEEDRPAKRPNVLFIAVDDLNDWTGFLGGHPQTKTPHLDRLAERSMAFTRAYCSAPACNPSRASLLTGRLPSNSGVYHNPDPWRRALPDVRTLPQHFQDNGYDVAGCGKIFHGSQKDPQSWGAYFARPGDPKPKDRPVNGIPGTAHFDWGPVEEGDADMGDRAVVDWGREFLAREHEKPFFLAVGLYRPHLPWYVPREHFEAFPAEDEEIELPPVTEDDLDDVPPAGRKIARPDGDHRRVTRAGEWHRAVRGYLASIRFADAMVGRLIAGLDESPHAKDTIIVLWGDHGWHLGEKQHWRKFALWEEATRVPLLISAPGATTPGSRCERPVSLVDLYPTLIELCGLSSAPDLDGQSLVPLLESPTRSWDRPALTTHGRGNHALRTERWRYIRYADGSEELYDHDADPLEWKNLAGSPEHAELRRELARWLPKHDAPAVERAGARRRAGS